jgi:hypothetical protein
MTSPPPDRSQSRAVRLAWRVTLVLALAFGFSTIVDLGILRGPLLALAAVGVVTTGWLAWDETRGEGHALASMRARWLSELPCSVDGDRLVLDPADGGPPRLVRLARLPDGTPCAAVFVPTAPATDGFRIWPRVASRPGFDGAEPQVGGPALTPLPGAASILQQLLSKDAETAPAPRRLVQLEVEGNAPELLLSRLRKAPRAALVETIHLHGDAFRGMTFDGAELGTHWVGPVALDPPRLMAAATPLLDAMSPRPVNRPTVLN